MDEIVRKSSLMGELVIKQVSKELAREMIIKTITRINGTTEDSANTTMESFGEAKTDV